ncbi:MAG: hypothetical protein QNJ72_27100 [Pleurocapsa sp. MO_226.B13]|nr:hypothetical protein [Pleurocapsa sp. MO_226.B13]
MILFIKADGVDLLQPDRLLSSITFQTFKPDRHQWLLSSYVYINNSQPGLSAKIKPSIASISRSPSFSPKIFIDFTQ